MAVGARAADGLSPAAGLTVLALWTLAAGVTAYRMLDRRDA